MEAATTTQRKRKGLGLSSFIATRRGALIVAGIAAALAAAALVAYLASYRTDVRGGAVPTQVLVADRLIPAGTSGEAVATGRLFKPVTVTADDVEQGALANAATLGGTVAARDIYPGEQIAAGDFKAGGDSLRGQLSADLRAVAMPVDQAHGLVGDLEAGDHVDAIASFTGGAGEGLARTIAQDVLVLKAPDEPENSSSAQSSVVLRLNDQQATQLAYAADNGKVWLALRAPAGATESRPTTVTDATVTEGN